MSSLKTSSFVTVLNSCWVTHFNQAKLNWVHKRVYKGSYTTSYNVHTPESANIHTAGTQHADLSTTMESAGKPL